jgi:hypothetical protein
MLQVIGTKTPNPAFSLIARKDVSPQREARAMKCVQHSAEIDTVISRHFRHSYRSGFAEPE